MRENDPQREPGKEEGGARRRKKNKKNLCFCVQTHYDPDYSSLFLVTAQIEH